MIVPLKKKMFLGMFTIITEGKYHARKCRWPPSLPIEHGIFKS
jgi:hypothetical protein